jgi:hypothetical protein
VGPGGLRTAGAAPRRHPAATGYVNGNRQTTTELIDGTVAVVDAQRRDVLNPDRVFGDVIRWTNETGTGTPAVQPGSDLAADAALSPKWQVAHAAWGCWVSAVDNLSALQRLVESAIQPYAPYSLLRVAIENAATTVWLLQPDASTDRVARRLQLVWDECKDVESLEAISEKLFEGKPGAKARRDEVRGLAQTTGIPLEQIAGRLSWASVVQKAEAATPLTTIELMWRLCSGFAHARDWARWSWLDLAHVGEKDGDIVTTKTTTSIDRIMMMALGAHELLKSGRQLYDKRRLTWVSH